MVVEEKKEEPQPKPKPKKPLPMDFDSEAAFIEWVDRQPIDGKDCSVLKESHVDVTPDSWFYRVALKSRCLQPVTYAIAMTREDWSVNMALAYPDILIDGCHLSAENPALVECLIRLNHGHPVTGW